MQAQENAVHYKAQDTIAVKKAETPAATYVAPSPERKDYISSGFYLSIGPVFPVGGYKSGQFVPIENPVENNDFAAYLPAKMGASMDMGFLIYLGPSFADKHLRAGIDATFLNFWFNSTKPLDPDKKFEHYYYYVGQKFGPLLTINPVDRLMLDLSWKINCNAFYHNAEKVNNDNFSKYGIDVFQQEVSFGIRYRIMLFSFQYNFGTMKYNNFDKERPNQTIDVNTFRIMVGLKF